MPPELLEARIQLQIARLRLLAAQTFVARHSTGALPEPATWPGTCRHADLVPRRSDARARRPGGEGREPHRGPLAR
jgi:hypothetical protein